jgi:hypothetical protein
MKLSAFAGRCLHFSFYFQLVEANLSIWNLCPSCLRCVALPFHFHRPLFVSDLVLALNTYCLPPLAPSSIARSVFRHVCLLVSVQIHHHRSVFHPSKALSINLSSVSRIIAIFCHTLRSGDTGVGKSCLLLQFTDRRFQPVCQPPLCVALVQLCDSTCIKFDVLLINHPFRFTTSQLALNLAPA